MDYQLTTIKKTRETSGILLLRKYFGPYWPRLLFASGIVLLGTVTLLLIPFVIGKAIDSSIAASDLAGLGYHILVIIGLAVVSVIAAYNQISYTGRLGQDILYKMRTDVFARLQSLPLRFFAVNRSGDIINRLTTDEESIQNFLSEGFIRMMGVIFQMVGVVILMFLTEYRLTLVSLGVALIIAFFLVFQGQVLKYLLRKSQDLNASVSNQIQEILNGFKVIKSYNQEGEMQANFMKANQRYYRSALWASFFSSMINPILITVSAFTTLGIILLALQFNAQAQMTAGEVFSYVLYLGYFLMPFRELADLWRNIQNGLAASQRINELLSLHTNIEEVDKPFAPEPSEVKGEIEFQDLSFGYEDETELVLKDVNFTVAAGQTVAIVGPTGGGKTTFVNLIARLYDTTSGAVKIDGVNVKDWKLNTLRDQIGYLLQDTFLFEDTVKNNLSYIRPGIGEDQIWAVLEAVGGADFVRNMENGLETVIKGNGQNISAGQRQILAIARLLLSDPKIIILDEATANIDTKAEKVVQQAIEVATKGRTSLIIAHRLSTIKNADWVILIQENTICESGTIDQLLAQKGRFYSMYSKFIGNTY